MLDEVFLYKDSDIPASIDGVDRKIFSPLRSGLLKERLVKIVYQKLTGEKSERKILPEVIFLSDGCWYVAGFCHLREEARTFRLDRIIKATLTRSSDTTHGVAQDIREHGVPWTSDLPEDPGDINWESNAASQTPSADYCYRILNCNLRDHAGRGELDRVKEDLAAGADINFKDYQSSPLHAAARSGCCEVMKYLIKHGADHLIQTDFGSILHEAVRGGKLKIVRYCIKKLKMDVNIRDRIGITPLYWAACDGRRDILLYLLKHGADINAGTCDGNTALMCAVSGSHTPDTVADEFAKILIKRGAKLDMQDRYGKTALRFALESGKDMCLKRLLKAGASPLLCDRKGVSPLLYLFYRLEEFKKNSRVNNFEEIYCEFEKRVQLLIAYDADINVADRDGVTPVMLASGRILNDLLTSGANVNARDVLGRTALMYHSQNRDDLSLLKRYGADFSARDLQGNDLLLSSPVKYDVVKMLVEDFGCDVNTKNASGMTPLHLSCESPDVDVVKFLVDHGADPNAENQKGQTPVDIVYDRSEHDEFGWEEEDDAIIDYFSSLQGSSGN